jgi:hypothetical protein
MEWYGGDGISIWFHESWTVGVVSVLEVEFWSGLKFWFDGLIGCYGLVGLPLWYF